MEYNLQKLYIKRKLISSEDIKRLISDNLYFRPGSVVNYNEQTGQKNSLVNPSSRKCVIAPVRPENYPDLCNQILDIIPLWNDSLFKDQYKIGELQYTKYVQGDFFKMHRDAIDQPGEKVRRIFSTSTILSKSDDLSGGEFLIKDNDRGVHPVPLEVGETLFFDSRSFHQVSGINKGTRDALVAWIWKK